MDALISVTTNSEMNVMTSLVVKIMELKRPLQELKTLIISTYHNLLGLIRLLIKNYC